MDETRSIRSEFDYNTKKKFVDIMNPMNNKSKLKAGNLAAFNSN